MKLKIFSIYSLLDKSQKIKLNSLILLTILTFFLEYLSLLSLPILASFISNNYIFIEKLSEFFNTEFLEIFDKSQLLFYTVIFTVSIFIAKNIFLILLNFLQFKFFKNLKVDFGMKIFSVYIRENYLNHISRNPSELTRDIADELDNFLSYYSNLLIMLREILAIISIFFLLIFVNIYIVLLIVFFLGSVSFIYFKKIKPLIKNKSIDNQFYRKKIIQHLNETNGLIKEIKILGKENDFIKKFFKIKNSYENNLLLFEIVQRLPKYFLEIIVITFLVVLSFIFLTILDDQSFLFALLPVILVSFLRFIPAFNGISAIVTYLKIYKPSVDLINNKMNSNIKIFDTEKEINNKKLNLIIPKNDYENYLNIKNITFSYPNNKNVFKNLNVKITEGSKFGIVGSSGSGKTTIFNIMLGLLVPNEGDVLFKDESIFKNLNIWRKNVGYLSQNIYLLDSSIKENITLNNQNNDKKDYDLDKAIEISNLKQKISSLPDGIMTKVGNDGIKLSGGEKQRIALARAIYFNPNIFFLDEPTSSLDNTTEDIIMNNFDKNFRNKTIISIAHRKSTIDRCDTIFDLNKLKN